MAVPWLKLLLLFLGLSAASGAFAQSQTKFRGNVFCCVSEAGQRVCGDVVPRPCAGRGYSIYSGKTGQLLRTIASPIRKEERAQMAAEKVREERETQESQEIKLRRRAILSTYASLAELDRLRSETETPLKRDIADAQQRIDAARRRLAVSQETAKRYTKDKMPPELVKSMRDDDMEIKFQTELIKIKQQDLDKVTKKFEEDRGLYQEATGK
ncbi:MAG: hypothetical protein LBO00_10155 [Zoogloeaceae bacterium]|jgi:hypothetical protein|nr:hypothetical protein [Zoogloeaceae bacterium]